MIRLSQASAVDLENRAAFLVQLRALLLQAKQITGASQRGKLSDVQTDVEFWLTEVGDVGAPRPSILPSTASVSPQPGSILPTDITIAAAATTTAQQPQQQQQQQQGVLSSSPEQREAEGAETTGEENNNNTHSGHTGVENAQISSNRTSLSVTLDSSGNARPEVSSGNVSPQASLKVSPALHPVTASVNNTPRLDEISSFTVDMVSGSSLCLPSGLSCDFGTRNLEDFAEFLTVLFAHSSTEGVRLRGIGRNAARLSIVRCFSIIDDALRKIVRETYAEGNNVERKRRPPRPSFARIAQEIAVCVAAVAKFLQLLTEPTDFPSIRFAALVCVDVLKQLRRCVVQFKQRLLLGELQFVRAVAPISVVERYNETIHSLNEDVVVIEDVDTVDAHEDGEENDRLGPDMAVVSRRVAELQSLFGPSLLASLSQLIGLIGPALRHLVAAASAKEVTPGERSLRDDVHANLFALAEWITPSDRLVRRNRQRQQPVTPSNEDHNNNHRNSNTNAQQPTVTATPTATTLLQSPSTVSNSIRASGGMTREGRRELEREGDVELASISDFDNSALSATQSAPATGAGLGKKAAIGTSGAAALSPLHLIAHTVTEAALPGDFSPEYLSTIAQYCGESGEGSLVAVGITRDVICRLESSQLRFLFGRTEWRRRVASGILGCLTSLCPAVLEAGLETLQRLVTVCPDSLGSELGFIYTSCVFRLLESDNTPATTRRALLRHVAAAFFRAGSAPPPLLRVYEHFDLNVRWHQLNVVQQAVATLSKAVRRATPEDFADLPPLPLSSAPPPPHSPSSPFSSPLTNTTATAVGTRRAKTPAYTTTATTSSSSAIQTLTEVEANAHAEVPQKSLPFLALHGLTLAVEFLAAQNPPDGATQPISRLPNRDAKLEEQRMIDIINSTPLKGVRKLFNVSDAEMRPNGSDAASENGWAHQHIPLPDCSETAEKIGHVARFLLETPSLNPESVAEFLTHPAVFPLQVCKAFMGFLSLAGKGMVDGMKELFSVVQVPKEGQRIERLLEYFCSAYYQANIATGVITEVFPFTTENACFIVGVATIMLNTNLHNPHVSSAKMTATSFHAQLRGCNDGKDFGERFTNSIFDEIRRNSLSGVKGFWAAGMSSGVRYATVPMPGKMDSIFFSSEERREMAFAVERQRLLSETRELIARRSAFDAAPVHRDASHWRAVAQDLFLSTWPSLCAVFGVAGLGPQVPEEALLLCVRGLRSSLLFAAAFGLQTECDVSLLALLRMSSLDSLRTACHGCVLEAAASPHSMNFTVRCWAAVAELLVGIRKHPLPGLLEREESVFARIEEYTREHCLMGNSSNHNNTTMTPTATPTTVFIHVHESCPKHNDNTSNNKEKKHIDDPGKDAMNGNSNAANGHACVVRQSSDSCNASPYSSSSSLGTNSSVRSGVGASRAVRRVLQGIMAVVKDGGIDAATLTAALYVLRRALGYSVIHHASPSVGDAVVNLINADDFNTVVVPALVDVVEARSVRGDECLRLVVEFAAESLSALWTALPTVSQLGETMHPATVADCCGFFAKCYDHCESAPAARMHLLQGVAELMTRTLQIAGDVPSAAAALVWRRILYPLARALSDRESVGAETCSLAVHVLRRLVVLCCGATGATPAGVQPLRLALRRTALLFLSHLAYIGTACGDVDGAQSCLAQFSTICTTALNHDATIGAESPTAAKAARWGATNETRTLERKARGNGAVRAATAVEERALRRLVSAAEQPQPQVPQEGHTPKPPPPDALVEFALCHLCLALRAHAPQTRTDAVAALRSLAMQLTATQLRALAVRLSDVVRDAAMGRNGPDGSLESFTLFGLRPLATFRRCSPTAFRATLPLALSFLAAELPAEAPVESIAPSVAAVMRRCLVPLLVAGRGTPTPTRTLAARALMQCAGVAVGRQPRCVRLVMDAVGFVLAAMRVPAGRIVPQDAAHAGRDWVEGRERHAEADAAAEAEAEEEEEAVVVYKRRVAEAMSILTETEGSAKRRDGEIAEVASDEQLVEYCTLMAQVLSPLPKVLASVTPADVLPTNEVHWYHKGDLEKENNSPRNHKNNHNHNSNTNHKNDYDLAMIHVGDADVHAEMEQSFRRDAHPRDGDGNNPTRDMRGTNCGGAAACPAPPGAVVDRTRDEDEDAITCWTPPPASPEVLSALLLEAAGTFFAILWRVNYFVEMEFFMARAVQKGREALAKSTALLPHAAVRGCLNAHLALSLLSDRPVGSALRGVAVEVLRVAAAVQSAALTSGRETSRPPESAAEGAAMQRLSPQEQQHMRSCNVGMYQELALALTHWVRAVVHGADGTKETFSEARRAELRSVAADPDVFAGMVRLLAPTAGGIIVTIRDYFAWYITAREIDGKGVTDSRRTSSPLFATEDVEDERNDEIEEQ